MKNIKIASEAQTLDFFRSMYGKERRKHRIYAFYSSQFGKMITD